MEIVYHPQVIKNDIPKIDKISRKKIQLAIEYKLLNPTVYGIPLKGTLKSFWKLRVGDYRVVYTILKNKIAVLVIAHRKEVYSVAERRVK
ncbi:MAG: type II toxin-antitoxin system mRNA interferase toxin, RelE/StbE family [Parcubacteria group bacterium]